VRKLRFVDGGLAGDIYFNDQIAFQDAALFLYGFPAFVGPTPVTVELVNGGYLAFQPHYFGSYDSSGPHSPYSLLDTCRATDELFQRGHVTLSGDGKPHTLPSKASLCVAHSFGCLVALRAVNLLSSIESLVLLAPAVHYGRSDPDFGLKENGLKHLEYVRASHPLTYRLAPKDHWIDLLTGRDALPRNGEHRSLKRVLAVVGDRDEYFDKEALRRNLPLIVRAYCGPNVEFDLHALPFADHSLDELVPAMKRQGLGGCFTSAGGR
jgi:hypothetical protein